MLFRNSSGEIQLMFSRSVGVKESNEAELMAILEALSLFSKSFQAKFIVESDLSNALLWALHHASRP